MPVFGGDGAKAARYFERLVGQPEKLNTEKTLKNI